MDTTLHTPAELEALDLLFRELPFQQRCRLRALEDVQSPGCARRAAERVCARAGRISEQE